jgi:hypothetical protein
VIAAVTDSYVNGESKSFSAAIRPDSAVVGGQIAQQAGSMTVVADAGEPLSSQAADLVRRRQYTTELRRSGASLRSIARQVGASPATVLRDLRRDVDWASDQGDREDMRETRERLRERQA